MLPAGAAGTMRIDSNVLISEAHLNLIWYVSVLGRHEEHASTSWTFVAFSGCLHRCIGTEAARVPLDPHTAVMKQMATVQTAVSCISMAAGRQRNALKP